MGLGSAFNKPLKNANLSNFKDTSEGAFFGYLNCIAMRVLVHHHKFV